MHWVIHYDMWDYVSMAALFSVPYVALGIGYLWYRMKPKDDTEI